MKEPSAPKAAKSRKRSADPRCPDCGGVLLTNGGPFLICPKDQPCKPKVKR